MRETTRRALNALNRAFYTENAESFSESRQHAWPGFARVLEAARTADETLRVLDVGAGDGRFAEYLTAHCGAPFEYLGVDLSAALLARTEARTLAAGCRFVRADIVEDASWLAALRAPSPSLVTLFGVMHHVPSRALRMRLLGELGRTLAPSGLLAITFWRLHEDPRFARRLVPWSVYNASAALPVPEDDLETGDVLLAWGDAEAAPRYCHFSDDQEIAELIAASGLSLQDRFRADGRSGALNEYVLLRATRS